MDACLVDIERVTMKSQSAAIVGIISFLSSMYNIWENRPFNREYFLTNDSRA
jgi:hypothetical protein